MNGKHKLGVFPAGFFVLIPGFSDEAFSGVPAFPGAEGGGSYAVGGRGCRVIEVTNLNESGPGSFRAAVETKALRIVVFGISGNIELKKQVEIRNPYIAIAGRTAPGDGYTNVEEYINGLVAR